MRQVVLTLTTLTRSLVNKEGNLLIVPSSVRAVRDVRVPYNGAQRVRDISLVGLVSRGKECTSALRDSCGRAGRALSGSIAFDLCVSARCAFST
jgi:hypothetical protein